MATDRTNLTPPPGSIVLFGGRGLVSWFIEHWTCSPYSHGAVVCDVSGRDLLAYRPVRSWKATRALCDSWRQGRYIIESTTLGNLPCAIQGKPFRGVQAHRFENRASSYDGKIWVMRPVEPLSEDESRRLTDVCLDMVGTPYDDGGAMLAGTRVLKRMACCFRRVSDRRTVFCIEAMQTQLKYALQGRIFPAIDPGQLSPREVAQLMEDWGLYHAPELWESRKVEG